MDLSLGFLFCSIGLYFCLCASTILSDDCGFVVEPEFRQVDSSSSILLSQDCFGYSRFFCEIICSSSVKNTVGSLIGIALNLYIALGSIFIFTILILPIHEHGIFLHLLVSSLISSTSVSDSFV